MFRTHHSQYFSLLVCALLGGFTGTRLEGSPTATYRSTATEVRLMFFASDENKQTVTTLQPSDFAVVDNELVVRDFRSFSRSAETRLEVAVVVDSSGSVISRYGQEVGEIAKLVSQLDGASDRVSVISFSSAKPIVLCSEHCQDSLHDQLRQLPSGGLTPLFDAVVLGVKTLAARHEPETRPILIVFSDGQDTLSQLSATDAIQAAQARETLIYAVDLADPNRRSSGSPNLKAMAEATGGRVIPISAGSNEVLGTIFDDLRSAYLVTYGLPNRASGFHSVQIFPTHNLNLTFHCRGGYYYPAAQDSD